MLYSMKALQIHSIAVIIIESHAWAAQMLCIVTLADLELLAGLWELATYLKSGLLFAVVRLEGQGLWGSSWWSHRCHISGASHHSLLHYQAALSSLLAIHGTGMRSTTLFLITGSALSKCCPNFPIRPSAYVEKVLGWSLQFWSKTAGAVVHWNAYWAQWWLPQAALHMSCLSLGIEPQENHLVYCIR